eukprot:scaffold58148_cov32-Tisochrysis_lutea.AAC.4
MIEYGCVLDAYRGGSVVVMPSIAPCRLRSHCQVLGALRERARSERRCDEAPGGIVIECLSAVVSTPLGTLLAGRWRTWLSLLGSTVCLMEVIDAAASPTDGWAPPAVAARIAAPKRTASSLAGR